MPPRPTVSLDGDQRLAVHQHEAVDWILESLRRRPGVMLCDDVGLGKSWVAAAVGVALQKQGWTIDLVIPAMLRDTWRLTQSSFGLVARLTTHEALRNRPIVPGDGSALVIVDESHRFRNPGTAMFRALGRLCAGRRVLLVTATPVWNSAADLEALLALIASDDALRSEGVHSIGRGLGDPRMRRRILDLLILRRDGGQCDLARSLPRVTTRIVRFALDDEGGRIGRAIERLRFPLVTEPAHRELVKDVLWRRLASSDAALDETLRRHRAFLARALDASRRGLRLTRKDWSRIFGDESGEPFVQDLLFPEIWMERDPGAMSLTEAIESEVAAIELLRRSLGRATKGKAARLRGILADGLPSIVFTVSVATARSIFRAWGERCGMMTARESRLAGERRSRPDTVVRAFREGRIDLLIATDCGAEGLDLQRAGRIVHYDLPWTSVRMRQRVGRANRIGQTRDIIESILFIPAGAMGRSIGRILLRKARLDQALFATPRNYATTGSTAAIRICREAMPPVLSRGSPQIRLFERLSNHEVLDYDLADRLTRRYRPGVEAILEESARGIIDAGSIESIRSLLRNEAELETPDRAEQS